MKNVFHRLHWAMFGTKNQKAHTGWTKGYWKKESRFTYSIDLYIYYNMYRGPVCKIVPLFFNIFFKSYYGAIFLERKFTSNTNTCIHFSCLWLSFCKLFCNLYLLGIFFYSPVHLSSVPASIFTVLEPWPCPLATMPGSKHAAAAAVDPGPAFGWSDRCIDIGYQAWGGGGAAVVAPASIGPFSQAATSSCTPLGHSVGKTHHHQPAFSQAAV